MTSLVTIRNSLASGELSLSLYGRTDLEKWHNGASTCRNFFVDYKGGVVSRPGTKYVGTSRQTGFYLSGGNPSPPRLIPFQFSLTQGYILEFGQGYIEFIQNGSKITQTPINVVSVDSSGVFTTSVNHGYGSGEQVYDTGNVGFAGLIWYVDTIPTPNTFTVTDQFLNPITSATPSVGGTVAKIYYINTPYNVEDLPYLKYTQSADTMTLCLVNTQTQVEYAPAELTRLGNANWTLIQDTFGSNINPPSNLSITTQFSSIPTTWYSYQVTSVDADTGEESIPCSPVNIQNCDIAIFQGSNILTWASVVNAAYYNIYASIPSYNAEPPVGILYGIVGSSTGLAFTDTNIIPDFSQTPPQNTNPFAIRAITGVVLTGGGGNYSQSNVSYGIVSFAGSGFQGTPIVNNLGWVGDDHINSPVTGFSIQDGGSNYELSDTFNFFSTSSGSAYATGWYDFNVGNPGNSTLVRLNGGNITFTTVDPPANPQAEVLIGGTLLQTLQNLEIFLNSTTNQAWAVAQYQIYSDNERLLIQYKIPGVIGNSYTLTSGTSYGGNPSGTTLVNGDRIGTGALGTPLLGPRSGTYPGVPAYYQQRKVFASSLNNPDTYWMSQPGLYSNFNVSIPVSDNNALSGTPWAQQVNGIQFMVPMPGGLVILTGKGAWQLNGGASAAITPANQVATPQAYNGCHNHVPPLTINYDILYVQAKGSIVRDLSYNFFVNIYTGTDLTLLSNHLFNNYEINEWCWAEEPFKLVWLVRSDGTLLSLTYLKEQDIYAWARHDTNGLFTSIASVTEPSQPESTTEPPALVDAVYVVTKRLVQGKYLFYIERFAERVWNNVEDSFCVDAGLEYPLSFPNATIYPSAIAGHITILASDPVFNSGMVGNIIRVDGGKVTITNFLNSTNIQGTVTDILTAVYPNDPLNTPIQANPNSWSISTPVTTISGLNHLNGLTVSILADGSVSPQQIVTNNSIILPEPASQIVVGLPYTCQLQTMYIDHTDQNGTQQNRRKTISAVGLRVAQSRGLQMGANQVDSSTQQNYATVPWINMTEIKERTNNVNAGNGIPLYTGDYYQAITAGWDTKGQVAIQQVYPLPANILAVISYWNTGDDK